MPAPTRPDAPITYVLPLRRARVGGDLPEVARYLGGLPAWVEVIVADGSPPAVFRAHRVALPERVRHMPLDAAPRFLNGKVSGVWTGMRRARHERVVIADDDVRYDADGLRRVTALLATADLAIPQNHFRPLPWHAWWDTGRTLLNRAGGGDHPGTLAVRRSRFMAMGGYEGDVMFENLELVRTVIADGGVVARAPWLHVERRPPDARHFLRQRVRQAYDDLAVPPRFAAELALAPAALLLAARGRRRALAGALVVAVAAAEAGRRADGGRAVFPARCSLAAPAWLAERAACAWIAAGLRIAVGGVPYAGAVLRTAAHPPRVLRRRQAARAARRAEALRGHR